MKQEEVIAKLATHFKERNDQLSLDCLRHLLTRNITQIEELQSCSLTSEVFTLTDKKGKTQAVPSEVVIYGAGVVGYFAMSIIESCQNSTVVAFVDSLKSGGYFGKPIVNIEQYKKQFVNIPVVVAIAQPRQIGAFLDESGISDYFYFGLKNHFWTRPKFREAMRLHIASGSPQYFSLPELPHLQDEVFVDCGVYDGETIKDFISWTSGGGGYKKIFAFEPDAKCLDFAKRSLEGIRDLVFIGAAVSDSVKTGKLKIKNTNSAGLGESSFLCDTDGDIDVPLTTIDRELIGERVTFIKMDIEGAELSALKGAQTIIKEQKPKLAISLYHKFEDIWTIPSYIWSLCPEYKFYLRHYSDTISETVLFGVP